MIDIKKRLQSLHNTINQAETQAQRPQNSVQLLAVSKTWPAELLRQAANAGQICFGENYLQEALIKIKALADLDLQWHFIGPIQSNKTKDIAQHFSWVQSVARIKIAQRLNKQRPDTLPALNVCVQVNIDDEKTKFGTSAAELDLLVDEIDQLDRLVLRGLMVIPTKTDNIEQQHSAFQRAHQLFTKLQDQYPTIDTLSMGMTADMNSAITQGSTMIRVGTGIFGQRHTPAE
ncbi:YggS family pyridoxal phosphate enzyme [Methylophaga sp. 42_25_T18]|nr:YggS family pyridoxal phosphate enzyme [Methylophaga sp. 42_25_T18]OUR86276.1 YggS family pyridoxal phosphate enzyme [Methylophaga sp. 42_8_T64]